MEVDAEIAEAIMRAGAEVAWNQIRSGSMAAEVKELKALRDRAEALLSQAQAAILGSGRYRPGIARLCEDLRGLEQSLDDLTKRQIAVVALWDDGYEIGHREASVSV